MRFHRRICGGWGAAEVDPRPATQVKRKPWENDDPPQSGGMAIDSTPSGLRGVWWRGSQGSSARATLGSSRGKMWPDSGHRRAEGEPLPAVRVGGEHLDRLPVC